jgi:uncharacterized protein involved in outer membrane biogenesis
LRIVVVVSLLLAALIAGALLVAPRLVAWNDYRAELTERAETITGQTVAVKGQIGLELLPQPTLTLAQTTLSGPPDQPGGVLEVDRLDLKLKPLPLLRGEFKVDEVRLVRPILQVEQSSETHPTALALLASSGIALSLAADGARRLSVVDGRAVLDGVASAAAREVRDINLDIAAQAPGGPFALDGDFVIAEQPFRLTAQLGGVAPDVWSSFQLKLTATETGADPASLNFRGLAWWDPKAPRLRGELTLAGSDIQTSYATFERASGAAGPAPPRWLSAPFRLAGHLQFADSQLQLDELRLKVADTEAQGKLDLDIAGRPRLDLQLDLPRLAVPGTWTQADLSLGPLAALATTVQGQIDLAIDALDYRRGTIRRVHAKVSLSGDGRMSVEQARAVLPGQTRIGFSGALAGGGEAAELSGTLTAVSDDLGTALAWLGLQPTGVPEGRLQTLGLASQVALSDQTLRLTDADLRVDASRLSGSLAVSLAPRSQIAAAVALDRLNLDAYGPEAEPARLIEGLAQTFSHLDAAIEAQVGRLTWRDLRLHDVTLTGRVVGGRLTLSGLSAGGDAESDVHLSGDADLEHRTFDLEARLQTDRPAQLLRSLGVEPPIALARLTPVSLDGRLEGDARALDLKLALHHGQARLDVNGAIDWSGERPTYALELDASHPDYWALLDELGVVRAPDGEQPAQLSLSGKLQGNLVDDANMVGTARFGDMSVTGRVGWQRASSRPRISVRLSVGQPSLETLLALATVGGLRLAPGLMAQPLAGNWPQQPLALGRLDQLDADIQVSGKGGLVGSGFELAAKLDQGKLMIDRLSSDLWQGRIEIQASVDGGRQLPFMALALDLRSIDAAALAAWLGLPPVIGGSADLHAEATTAGDSLRDLIRGLIGDVKVDLRDGPLLGVALAQLRDAEAPAARSSAGAAAAGASTDEAKVPSLAGRFALKRGIATARSVQLGLDGTKAQLSGTIDLLVWAADLTLRPENAGAADAVALRLIGPLDRPQIRLLEPPVPIVPGQAP